MSGEELTPEERVEFRSLIKHGWPLEGSPREQRIIRLLPKIEVRIHNLESELAKAREAMETVIDRANKIQDFLRSKNPKEWQQEAQIVKDADVLRNILQDALDRTDALRAAGEKR